MLFKSKGIQRYLNYLPLIIQALLFNISWKLVFSVMQITLYTGVLAYVIYHLTVWL